MKSLRTQALKIGIPSNHPIQYRAFTLRPDRLSVAMRAMESPGGFVEVAQSADRDIDENWTQECQGIAWVGTHWIAASNGSDWFPSDVESKALYTFNPVTKFTDDDIVSTFRFTSDALPGFPFEIFHVGCPTYQNDLLWLDHWTIAGRGQVLKFKMVGGVPQYQGYIDLVHPSGRVAFVGISRWNGELLTCSSDINVDRLYIHAADGNYSGRFLLLDPPISDGGYMQGGFFSPNGHIFLSSGNQDITPLQFIYCYSALNGKQIQRIAVNALEGKQELEGCTFASVTMDGHAAQIVAVLLENHNVASDDAYIKAFCADFPEFL